MTKNLIPNSDFELSIEGWADLGSGVTVNTLATTTIWSPSGAKALEYKVTNSTGSAKNGTVTQPNGALAPMPIKAGTSYTFRALLNILDVGNGTGADLAIVWYTAAGAQVGSVSESEPKSTKLGEQTLSLTATAPATAERASVRVRLVNIANGKIGWFYLDSIEFFDASEITNLEKIVCNGFNFNDQVKTSLESLVFNSAQPKAKLAENPNTDGVLLIEEPHFTPAYFEAQVRILTKSTLDEALAVVGELIDALQGCAQIEGGAPIEWTPNTTSTTYVAYGLFAEIVDIPITVEGELAGWFVRTPVLKIKLTCRPFLHTEERVVLETTESTEQFQTVYIGGIGGDVPAEARMIVTDKATQLRRFIEWGQDLVESETNPSIRLKGEVLSVTGTSSTKVAKAGSISGEVIKATLLYGVPITVCTTGPIANVGTYRVKPRVFVESTQTGPICALRISYKIGEGGETKRKWVEVQQTSNWVEVDLEEVFAEEVERGEQVTQIQIQGQGTKYGCTIYIDTLSLIPTKRYAVGRGKLNYTEPSTYSGYDQFIQTAGSLTGKTAEVGGIWGGFGDADDFAVVTNARAAQRTAISDAAGTPRYAPLGATSFTDISVSAEVWTTNTQWDTGLVMGVLARYVDNNNWLMFGVKRLKTGTAFANEGNAYVGQLYKKVAGVKTEISSEIFAGTSALLGVTISHISLQLIALSTGEWKVGMEGTLWASGIDTDLGTAGALKTGKMGLFDEKTGATAETRSYDNFQAYVPTVAVVCNPSKALEANTQGANLEDTTGKYRSPMSEYRGADIYLDPAGKGNLINRLTVKMRRNDTPTETDPNVTDKQALKVYARERYLSPR